MALTTFIWLKSYELSRYHLRLYSAIKRRKDDPAIFDEIPWICRTWIA